MQVRRRIRSRAYGKALTLALSGFHLLYAFFLSFSFYSSNVLVDWRININGARPSNSS